MFCKIIVKSKTIPWGWIKMLFPEDRDDRVLLEQIRLGKIAKRRESLARKTLSLMNKKDYRRLPKGVVLVPSMQQSQEEWTSRVYEE